MGNLFGGWKRKAGLVTLALTCVVAAGMIRSVTHVDLIIVNQALALVSGSCKLLVVPGSYLVQIGFMEARDSGPYLVLIETTATAHTDRFFRSSVQGTLVYANATRNRGTPIENDDKDQSVPYWWIVTPLTLISAWLLLSKSPHFEPTEPA